jgi:crotonobetainyl-CoA:carnitine CoA-transferase CaiB-like acyl-CoA transferase
MNYDSDRKGPLDGIRIVDLSRLIAGNVMSQQLGDFGADVIKVEPPEGDPLRAWQTNGTAFYWKAYGRNKRSVVLNLREPAALDALLKILDGADVFIENFRPGTLEKMGLAPETLLKRNPGLVIVRISGFGQTGPYAQLPGFGTLVEAMSGLAARTGFPDREPVLPPTALADTVAGFHGAMAVMIALHARERGKSGGQVIDLSLLEPLISILGPEAALYRATGTVLPRVGSASNTASPRNVYRCRDGKYVALSGSIQSMAMRMFDMISRPDMKTDPRFSNNAARIRNRALVDEALGAWFGARDREEALRAIHAAEVTAGPVFDSADLEADPHFRERGVLVEVEDEELGSLPLHAITPRLSETPGVWRRPAPALGAHTREILAEAGLSETNIDAITGKKDVA